MAIQIGGYNFEGPYESTTDLREQSGVYAVLGGNGSGTWDVVDIGESQGVRSRVETHDRADCWKRRGHAKLACAPLYCSERDRMRVEQELRAKFKPPCGDR